MIIIMSFFLSKEMTGLTIEVFKKYGLQITIIFMLLFGVVMSLLKTIEFFLAFSKKRLQDDNYQLKTLVDIIGGIKTNAALNQQKVDMILTTIKETMSEIKESCNILKDVMKELKMSNDSLIEFIKQER